MPLTILGSYMVRYPLGGNLSWALQWLVGLQGLGHDLYFVEKATYADACFDPSRGVMTDDCAYGVGCVRSLLRQLGMDRRFCFVDAGGRYHGMSRAAMEKIFRAADLFIDMGTHGAWMEEAQQTGMRVLVELEPAYTQMKMQIALDEGGQLEAYDAYYTNGMNVGSRRSTAPTAGINWGHVFNPVVPDLFEVSSPPALAPFTTVMNWQSHDELEFRGVRYGQKDVEFEKFMSLPRLVDVPMEIAIAGQHVPLSRLQASGWRVRAAHGITHSVQSYCDYLSRSAGEFGVCKNVFVATRTGWFSDRSAAYLASGRPVVIQATGFEEHLPCGTGLFAVNTAAEAAEAIGQIVTDFSRHSAAARSIAVEHLSAASVLGRFVRELGF